MKRKFTQKGQILFLPSQPTYKHSTLKLGIVV